MGHKRLFSYLNNLYKDMAVPKKRTSKTKTRSRKAQWFKKAEISAKKAWSLGCSIAKGKSNSFILNTSASSEDK